MLAIGVVAAGYVGLWLRNARLLVGVDRFGLRDAFGRERVWTRDQVGRIVDVAILQAARKGTTAQRMIYFLRPDGRRLLLLSPNAWSEDAIDRVVQVTGRPLERSPEPMTRASFIATFPQATTWVGRHQNLTLVVMLAVPFAVAIAITVMRG